MRYVCAVVCLWGLSGPALASDATALPLAPGPVVDVPGQPVTNIDFNGTRHKDTCGAEGFSHLTGQAYGRVGTQLPIGTQVQQQDARRARRRSPGDRPTASPT
jgi:hypothetical protein